VSGPWRVVGSAAPSGGRKAGCSAEAERRPTPHISVLLHLSAGSSHERSDTPNRAQPHPPPILQTVESFGTLLGQEIVSRWHQSYSDHRTQLSGVSSPTSADPAARRTPAAAESPVGPGPHATAHAAACQPDERNASTPQPPSDDAAAAVHADDERSSAAGSRPGSASPATPSVSSPAAASRSAAATPVGALHPHLLLNGSPKSPDDDANLCSNNNTISSNNNLLGVPLLGPHNGLSSLGLSMLGGVGPNLPPVPPGHAHSLSNLLREREALKSPFRFDEQRHHFRFHDERALGQNGAMIVRLGESLIPKADPMEARLQEMLRYNMDKYANQNLDTLGISRRVRELLSIHNIGQRLFAKYVLGLSQGTVSELLSKPKPWDKLTEKGRDSYRKMHAWACDEHSIMLLKSLIPKKGKSVSLLPSNLCSTLAPWKTRALFS